MTTIPITLDRPELAPAYASEGDAGADLRAAKSITLAPGEYRIVPTGVRAAIPEGLVGLVHPRSGLAAKRGVTVLNAPGTIDSGYRGEIGVILINHSDESTTIEEGERIAQLVLQRFERVDFDIVETLDATSRGDGGFGSTGHN